MEDNQNTSLFGLSIDPASKAHLSEAARWARFLSIVGFVTIALLIVFGFFFGAIFGRLTNSFSSNQYGSPGIGGAMSSVIVFVYIVIGAIYFFPCLFLFRFGSKMKTALAANDQETINVSFQNLKKFLRFFGIVTIICLALFALQLLFVLLGAGLAGR